MSIEVIVDVCQLPTAYTETKAAAISLVENEATGTTNSY